MILIHFKKKELAEITLKKNNTLKPCYFKEFYAFK